MHKPPADYPIFGSKADIGEMSTMSPLYPNKRTSTDATGMSA